jgi:hypothetical protein
MAKKKPPNRHLEAMMALDEGKPNPSSEGVVLLDANEHNKKRRKICANLPWKEIKALYCAGVKGETIVGEYPGLTLSVLNKRASRKKWQSPAQLRKEAERLARRSEAIAKDLGEFVPDNPDAKLAEMVSRGIISHRVAILEEVEKSIEDLRERGPLPINSVNDLAKLDEVARRNLGLDKEDASNKFIFNLNALNASPEPIDV